MPPPPPDDPSQGDDSRGPTSTLRASGGSRPTQAPAPSHRLFTPSLGQLVQSVPASAEVSPPLGNHPTFQAGQFGLTFLPFGSGISSFGHRDTREVPPRPDHNKQRPSQGSSGRLGASIFAESGRPTSSQPNQPAGQPTLAAPTHQVGPPAAARHVPGSSILVKDRSRFQDQAALSVSGRSSIGRGPGILLGRSARSAALDSLSPTNSTSGHHRSVVIDDERSDPGTDSSTGREHASMNSASDNNASNDESSSHRKRHRKKKAHHGQATLCGWPVWLMFVRPYTVSAEVLQLAVAAAEEDAVREAAAAVQDERQHGVACSLANDGGTVAYDFFTPESSDSFGTPKVSKFGNVEVVPLPQPPSQATASSASSRTLTSFIGGQGNAAGSVPAAAPRNPLRPVLLESSGSGHGPPSKGSKESKESKEGSLRQSRVTIQSPTVLPGDGRTFAEEPDSPDLKLHSASGRGASPGAAARSPVDDNALLRRSLPLGISGASEERTHAAPPAMHSAQDGPFTEPEETTIPVPPTEGAPATAGSPAKDAPPVVSALDRLFERRFLFFFREPVLNQELLVFQYRSVSSLAAGFTFGPLFLLHVGFDFLPPLYREVRFIVGGVLVVLPSIDLAIHIFAPLTHRWAEIRRVVNTVFVAVLLGFIAFLMYPLAAKCEDGKHLRGVFDGDRDLDATLSPDQRFRCVGGLDPLAVTTQLYALVGVNVHPFSAAVLNVAAVVVTFLSRRWADSDFVESWRDTLVKVLVYAAVCLAAQAVVWLRWHNAFLTFEAAVRFAQKTQSALDRTVEINALLGTLVPLPVLPRLIVGGPGALAVDRVPEASVFFADMQSFTAWSSQRSAAAVAAMLNTLVAEIDQLAWGSEAVEKIKTIGDAYWAAAGIPVETGDHADRLTSFAAAFTCTVARIASQHSEWGGAQRVRFRAAVHSGPVFGALFGTKQVSYEVFGKTSRVAAMAQENAAAGTISITQETAAAMLDPIPPEFLQPHCTFSVDNAAYELFRVKLAVPHGAAEGSLSPSATAGSRSAESDLSRGFSFVGRSALGKIGDTAGSAVVFRADNRSGGERSGRSFSEAPAAFEMSTLGMPMLSMRIARPKKPRVVASNVQRLLPRSTSFHNTSSNLDVPSPSMNVLDAAARSHDRPAPSPGSSQLVAVPSVPHGNSASNSVLGASGRPAGSHSSPDGREEYASSISSAVSVQRLLEQAELAAADEERMAATHGSQPTAEPLHVSVSAEAPVIPSASDPGPMSPNGRPSVAHFSLGSEASALPVAPVASEGEGQQQVISEGGTAHRADHSGSSEIGTAGTPLLPLHGTASPDGVVYPPSTGSFPDNVSASLVARIGGGEQTGQATSAATATTAKPSDSPSKRPLGRHWPPRPDGQANRRSSSSSGDPIAADLGPLEESATEPLANPPQLSAAAAQGNVSLLSFSQFGNGSGQSKAATPTAKKEMGHVATPSTSSPTLEIMHGVTHALSVDVSTAATTPGHEGALSTPPLLALGPVSNPLQEEHPRLTVAEVKDFVRARATAATNALAKSETDSRGRKGRKGKRRRRISGGGGPEQPGAAKAPEDMDLDSLEAKLSRRKYRFLPCFADPDVEARFKLRAERMTASGHRLAAVMFLLLHVVVMIGNFAAEHHCVSAVGLTLQAISLGVGVAALVSAFNWASAVVNAALSVKHWICRGGGSAPERRRSRRQSRTLSVGAVRGRSSVMTAAESVAEQPLVEAVSAGTHESMVRSPTTPSPGSPLAGSLSISNRRSNTHASAPSATGDLSLATGEVGSASVSHDLIDVMNGPAARQAADLVTSIRAERQTYQRMKSEGGRRRLSSIVAPPVALLVPEEAPVPPSPLLSLQDKEEPTVRRSRRTTVADANNPFARRGSHRAAKFYRRFVRFDCPLIATTVLNMVSGLAGIVGTGLSGEDGCLPGYDVLYYGTYMFVVSCLMVGPVSWPFLLPLSFITLMAPTIVLGLVYASIPFMYITVAPLAAIFSLLWMYSEEQTLRRRFVEQEKSLVFEEHLLALHTERAALLETVVPAHVVIDLMAWFARGMDTESPIVRSYDTAVVIFARLLARESFLDDDVGEGVWLPVAHAEVDANQAATSGAIEKIKTIGDTVLFAGPFTKAFTLADAALAAAHAVLLLVRGKTQVQAGLHVGPVVGTVQGSSRLAFDIFGDAVNTASRVMTAGVPGDVMASVDFLKQLLRFRDIAPSVPLFPADTSLDSAVVDDLPALPPAAVGPRDGNESSVSSNTPAYVTVPQCDVTASFDVLQSGGHATVTATGVGDDPPRHSDDGTVAGPPAHAVDTDGAMPRGPRPASPDDDDDADDEGGVPAAVNQSAFRAARAATPSSSHPRPSTAGTNIPRAGGGWPDPEPRDDRPWHPSVPDQRFEDDDNALSVAHMPDTISDTESETSESSGTTARAQTPTQRGDTEVMFHLADGLALHVAREEMWGPLMKVAAKGKGFLQVCRLLVEKCRKPEPEAAAPKSADHGTVNPKSAE